MHKLSSETWAASPHFHSLPANKLCIQDLNTLICLILRLGRYCFNPMLWPKFYKTTKATKWIIRWALNQTTCVFAKWINEVRSKKIQMQKRQTTSECKGQRQTCRFSSAEGENALSCFSFCCQRAQWSMWVMTLNLEQRRLVLRTLLSWYRRSQGQQVMTTPQTIKKIHGNSVRGIWSWHGWPPREQHN